MPLKLSPDQLEHVRRGIAEHQRNGNTPTLPPPAPRVSRGWVIGSWLGIWSLGALILLGIWKVIEWVLP